MSELIKLSGRQSAQPKMRIGLLRLTDGAPVIAAYEFGFFADEGLEVEIFVEPSWANIADKLAYGFLDAAVIVPPLAFLVHFGLRGTAEPILIPYAISASGNTVTLTRGLAEEVYELSARRNLSRAEALAACLRQKTATLGVVHAYSTHNLLLRYWLATAGIEAGRDFKLAVVSPARVVEAMSTGQIAGFCAGAPWGEVARRAGVGCSIAASRDIWRNAPEKAFAVRAPSNAQTSSPVRCAHCSTRQNSATTQKTHPTPLLFCPGRNISASTPTPFLLDCRAARHPIKAACFSGAPQPFHGVRTRFGF